MLALQASEIKESFTAVRANRYRASWCIGQALSVYSNLFWREYLGATVWSLYEALKTAVTATAAGWMESPTISDLVSLMGQGDRYTILGRAATDSRPSQLGTLNALEDENIIVVRKTGVANHRKYHFGILMKLPILTPAQASQLPDPIQKKHTCFLGSLRGFDLPAWCHRHLFYNMPEKTAVPGWVMIRIQIFHSQANRCRHLLFNLRWYAMRTIAVYAHKRPLPLCLLHMELIVLLAYAISVNNTHWKNYERMVVLYGRNGTYVSSCESRLCFCER